MPGFLKVISKELSASVHALVQILCDTRFFVAACGGPVSGGNTQTSQQNFNSLSALMNDRRCFALSFSQETQSILLLPQRTVANSVCKMVRQTQHWIFASPRGRSLASPCSRKFIQPCSECSSFWALNVSFSTCRQSQSMLIGDCELSDLRDTQAVAILFVIFALTGAATLLNVPIAVVSDSCEKATISSLLLFGGARVAFAAGQESLESLLKPDTRPLPASSSALKNFGTASWRLFWWRLLLAIIATA